MGRKSHGMEKVENLCRTAREQNELINTSVQFSSRLREVSSIDRHARTIDASIHSEASPLISKPSQSVPRGGGFGKVGSDRLAATVVGREPVTASGPMTSQIRLQPRARAGIGHSPDRTILARNECHFAAEFCQMLRESAVIPF